MDLRERDTRYMEQLLHVSMMEMIGNSILAVLMAGLKLEGKHAFTREKVDKLLQIYRDKLFHTGYLPEYEKRLHEAMSGKSGDIRAKTAEDLEQLRKLDSLTDRDPF